MKEKLYIITVKEVDTVKKVICAGRQEVVNLLNNLGKNIEIIDISIEGKLSYFVDDYKELCLKTINLETGA